MKISFFLWWQCNISSMSCTQIMLRSKIAGLEYCWAAIVEGKKVRICLCSPFVLEYTGTGKILLAAAAWEMVLKSVIACTCSWYQGLKNQIHTINEEKQSRQLVPAYWSSSSKRNGLYWVMLQWVVTVLVEVYYFKHIIYRPFKSIKAYICCLRAKSDCTSKSGIHKELFRVVQWVTCRSDAALVCFGPAVLFCAAEMLAHERCLFIAGHKAVHGCAEDSEFTSRNSLGMP